MSSEFYSEITDVGKAKISNAFASKTSLDLVNMAVGDGGG